MNSNTESLSQDSMNEKDIENPEELKKMAEKISNLFKAKRNEELKKFFQLYKFSPQRLNVIYECLYEYILKELDGIQCKDKDTKILIIPETINFIKEMNSLVEECFENEELFQEKKNGAFRVAMNQEFYSKLLSNYLDIYMKGEFKGKSDEEIDNILNDAMGLYKYLGSKLSFQLEVYKRMNNRLLNFESVSINLEQKLIDKFKKEFGERNTFLLNMIMPMVTDYKNSKKYMDQYLTSQSKGVPNGIKFNVQVINLHIWDIKKEYMMKMEIPKFMKACMEDFENYLSKFTNNKLLWFLGLSKLEIQYLYLDNKNISISTLPQYLILLALEKNGTLTIGQVAELIGMPVNTIMPDIIGLVLHPSFNKEEQLEKSVIIGSFDIKKRDFKKTDTIRINDNLKIASQKFSTLPYQVKNKNDEENEEEATIIKAFQNNIIQATITRIMKCRIGEINSHDWLINEVTKNIALFDVKPKQIKANIEKLIDKNVIKRSDKNRNCYDYIP
jgi:DNA-binding MarR family transcriptional regulator